MEANEADKAAEQVVEETRRVVGHFGGRAPGSMAELGAQTHFAATLRTFADDVHLERFVVHPHALMGWVPLIALVDFCAVAMFWAGLGAISFVFSHFSLLVLLLELGLYHEFLDPLFPARISHNVVARIPPLESIIKRRIIISGHTDSAWAWTFNRGHKLVLWSALGLQTLSAFGIALTAYLSMYKTLAMGIAHAAMCLCLASSFANTQFWNSAVPGANDNLTGAIGTIEVARHFSVKRLRDTELVVLLTGSEEAGLRGAKAFARTHLPELVSSGIETAFIGMDTLRDLAYLSVAHKDLNGFVSQDERLISLLLSSSNRELGHPIRKQCIFLGASDAAAIGQVGVPAVGLVAMDPGPPLYYHTFLDAPDNMNVQCIAAALRVCARAIVTFDEIGLGEQLQPSPAAAPGETTKLVQVT